MLEGKTIFISGGAGSLGRALVDQLFDADQQIAKVIIYSRDELKHHYMAWDLPTDKFPINYVIGDIRDYDRLYQALEGVDIVVHAAALKQVNACEHNPDECYKTNVIGSQNLIKGAIAQQVSKVLLISSDKAVDPVSVYGNSKQAAEKLFMKADESSKPVFSILRLGNLMGSAGSVVPIFKHMSESGTIPITNPNVTRFFGSLEDGASAITFSIANMRGGEIFIPKWKTASIGDLARIIAPECKMELIGMRKHEKIHEKFYSNVEEERLLEDDEFLIITSQELSNDQALDFYGALKAERGCYSSESVERIDARLLKKMAGYLGDQRVSQIE